jgi:predicted Zn-dependent protease
LTRKIDTSPHDPSLRCQAAELFLQAGNEKEGLRWLETALKEDPGNKEVYRTLARYYRDHGRPELAAKYEPGPSPKP